MPTKIVKIDGKDVPMRSSAGIPRLYRIKFGRDILVDMREIGKAVEESQRVNPEGVSTIPVELLTLFEDVAYIMAKHADKDSVPGSVEEWLDGFDTFSIYAVFPEIEKLWADNLRQLGVSAKK